jgi:hypothetical protein
VNEDGAVSFSATPSVPGPRITRVAHRAIAEHTDYVERLDPHLDKVMPVPLESGATAGIEVTDASAPRADPVVQDG